MVEKKRQENHHKNDRMATPSNKTQQERKKNTRKLKTTDYSISFDKVKNHWLQGDWEQLTQVDESAVAAQKKRAELALLLSSACQQLNQPIQAREWINKAKHWGSSKTDVAKILLSDLYNTLGRIAALQNDTPKANQYFQTAVKNLADTEIDQFTHSRSVREMTRLGLLPQAATSIEEKLSHPVTHSMALILKSELELLTHELSLAHQRQQLYNSGLKNDSLNQIRSGSQDYLDDLKRKSVSQLGQDLWVLKQTDYKREGFFVEFGATDGILLSNTYLLESEFKWRGICAEPNPIFFEKLKKNRRCITSNSCIGGTTGEEVEFILAEEYGGIEKYANSDMHMDKREAYKNNGQVISLSTISLHEILLQLDAPKIIDYLSIDTEGSEYDILSTFPFEQWDIRLITVEHNFTEQRDKIFKLLTEKGYSRLEAQWDDWYYRDNN